MEDIKEHVRGRWTSIFQHLGIDVGDGRHTECPICGVPGNKKPFRYDDLDGSGSWICSYCGAGDGWALLMKKFSLQFPEAVKEVERVIGDCQVTKTSTETKVSPNVLRNLFQNSHPMRFGDIAAWYLQCRGLSVYPPTLLTTQKCWLPDDRSYHNAMLAIFRAQDGTAITMHRTYLNEHGEKLETIQDPKRIMPSLGKMAGGAVRLFPVTDGVLGVAEGIETAIAAHELFGVPVWPTLTSTLLADFDPPPGIKTLLIFSDNDINFTGQCAAYTLGKKIMVKPTYNIDVNVIVPPTPGDDFLDVLLKGKKQLT
jgi:putative DNA primase/helicase